MSALMHGELWIVVTNVLLAHVTWRTLPDDQRHIIKKASITWTKRVCRIRSRVRNTV
jgi:TRAP-type C4-dicarboxylate transport system substrate-binding protein